MADHEVRATRLGAGWQSLRHGDWQGARSCFEELLRDGESGEAYEGLGWAAYCLDEDPLTFRARESAYRLYRREGDDRAAARVAAWLAADWIDFRGEPAVANGWIRRARRLLEPLPPSPDHGWLALHEASIVVDDEPAAARDLAAEAVAIGRRFGVPELEMVGLAVTGVALIGIGQIDDGMRHLDEATALALGGEAELLVCVAWACCYLIGVCEQLRDFDRAGEWCGRVADFCREHEIALPLSVCRASYGGVLTWQGRWREAEDELLAAAEGLGLTRRPLVDAALLRLAELRIVQGRMADAAELLRRCEGHPRALLGHARIALDEGRPTDAAELAERFLRRYPDSRRIERCAGLEVGARAYAALEEWARADELLGQLGDLAEPAGARALRAGLLRTRAAVAGRRGELDAARVALEDALDLLTAGAAPFETASARAELASVLERMGRREAATVHLAAALAGFRALDAPLAAARAEAALVRLAPAPSAPAAVPAPLGALTAREREVLDLVTEGLTNHEIAARLSLSEHTVHRHMTNILRKLAVPSRAAAAALATRHSAP